jgi:RNA polymerase sigma-70 factor (ECF subfamily)
MPSHAAVAAAAPSPATDVEIVRRVRAGDVALFEILMHRHNPLVYRTLRSLIRDEAEVEDAMQQSYLRAFTHLDDFKGQSAFSTWLVRIAVNEGLGRLRARSRVSLVEEIPEVLDPPQVMASTAFEPTRRTRTAMDVFM